MTKQAPILNQSPGEKQRMLGAFMSALRSHSMMSENMLPAMVQSYDRVNNVATVQPLIQWVDMADNFIDRDSYAQICVLSLGGGGFNINFPLQAGDIGWILSSDRDIALFKQSLAKSPPNSGRLHKFADGWFVPDVFRKYTIASENASAMVIQSVDGTTSIAISEGVVNITAPTSVKVTTPTATFTGNVIIDQNLTVNQNTEVKQNLTVDSGATLPAGSTIGGINVSTHGHTSNSPGNRTIGNMIS